MALFDGFLTALRRLFGAAEKPQTPSQEPAVPLVIPEDTPPAALLDEATREAARFLTENPLYPYRNDATGELNVVIVGESNLRTAFFSTVFSAAQMLDTQLQIHILAADAEDFCHQLVAQAPALPHVCEIRVNGERKAPATPLVPELLGENAPLANLYFQDADTPSAEAILALNPGVVVLMDDDTALAAQLKAQCAGDLLIGIARDSLDPVTLPEEVSSPHRVQIAPYIFDAELTDDFYAQAEQVALAIHSFYTLEFNERASKAEIRRTFRDQKTYNFRSSLRSALAIPYKLYACGMTADTEDVSGRFAREVLENPDKRLLSRLIWLEHRSWQAFMIMEGWQLLPEEEYHSILFSKENSSHNHKDNAGRRHPCLCASHDDGTFLPMDAWQDGEAAPEITDPLDHCSLQIHRCFENEIAQTRYQTSSIENCLKNVTDRVDESLLPYIRELENVTHRVLNGDIGLERLWKKLYEALLEKIDGSKKALDTMETLREKMEVRIRALHPRDFKHTDLDVIEAIPMILQDHPVRQIYKLFSPNNWENLISAAFIRPNALVLVTEPGKVVEESEITAYQRFLEARGLGDCLLSQCAVDALESTAEHSVLDITGASAAQMLRAKADPHLAPLPVIEYHKGDLRYLSSNDPNARLYRHGCNLSVRDVLTVSGARVISDREERHLLGMGEDAEALWKIAQNAFDQGLGYYNNFCTLLKSISLPDLEIAQRTRQSSPYWCALSEDKRISSGLQAVVTGFQYCSAIPSKKEGCTDLMIKADDAWWQGGFTGAVKDMEAVIGLNINDRSFELVTIVNPLYQPGEPESSNNSRYIQLVRDNCLEHYVTFPIVGNDAIEIPNADRIIAVSHVKTMLDELQKAGLIRPRSDSQPIHREFLRNRKPHLALSFAFVSPAVRECLTKEGNIQEAFVYRVIRDADIFDDLKLSVSIAWDEQNKDATTNEIDLIGTKGNQSYFISCKKRVELRPEQLTEIRYESDRFGIDGVPILIATAKDDFRNHASYVRAGRMGVHIIRLEDYLRSDGSAQDSADVLISRLKKIVEEN